MDKLKLMKTANEIRKGIVKSVHSAKAGIRVYRFQRQKFSRIFILKS